MKSMKKAEMPLSVIVGLAIALVLALVLLVFVIGGGRDAMIEMIEGLFEFLRFGT